jgi:hypothetical protein
MIAVSHMALTNRRSGYGYTLFEEPVDLYSYGPPGALEIGARCSRHVIVAASETELEPGTAPVCRRVTKF